MNFKELSYKKYGKTLAELFLINYTEKLWGLDAENLNNKTKQVIHTKF